MHPSPALLIFITPLLLGILLIFAAFRLRSTPKRVVAALIGAPLLLFFGFLVLTCGTQAPSVIPYMWASILETKWRAANPQTQGELESHLSLYSQRDIQPSQSDWGRNYQLRPGE